MTLREQIAERNRQWRLFHDWEADKPTAVRSPEAVLADLGWLLQWFSPEIVRSDPDPEKQGIARMRAALALLSQR